MTELLSQTDREIVTAYEPGDALSLIQQQPFDLIV